MTSTTPPPVSSRVRLYQALGVIAVAASTAFVTAFAARPGWWWLPIANMVIAVLVGKWLGIPLAEVITLALSRMPPERAVQIAVDALKSLPPEEAEDATRTLLRSIPPAAAQRVMNEVGVEEMAPLPPSVPTSSVPPEG